MPSNAHPWFPLVCGLHLTLVNVCPCPSLPPLLWTCQSVYPSSRTHNSLILEAAWNTVHLNGTDSHCTVNRYTRLPFLWATDSQLYSRHNGGQGSIQFSCYSFMLKGCSRLPFKTYTAHQLHKINVQDLKNYCKYKQKWKNNSGQQPVSCSQRETSDLMYTNSQKNNVIHSI